jgi:predicted PurR-regulated permease PerM
VLLFVPEKNHSATRKVIHDSKKMLMRYFIGVLLEVLGVMTIITIGLWVLGVDNALLIGFFGGIMNLIPYLGPVLGTLIGMMLGMTTTLATGNYQDIVPVLLKLIGVFPCCQCRDNNVLVLFNIFTTCEIPPP